MVFRVSYQPTGINSGTQSVIPVIYVSVVVLSVILVRQVSVVVLRVSYQSDRCQKWYSEWHTNLIGVSSGTQSGIPVR